MVKILGFLLGFVVVLTAINLALVLPIYYGYNFLAVEYGWPIIKSYWHAFIGVFLVIIISNLIRGAKK